MKKAVIASVKQALGNRGFLIGVIGVITVILLASVKEILSAFRSETLLSFGYHDELIRSALASDAMALSLPILSALPYTASFVDDMKSGFIKAYLPRTMVKRYVWSKSIACAVSGGLVLALGLTAAYGIVALMLLPMEAQLVLAKGEKAPQYLWDFAGRVLMYFNSGALWAMVGMTFATLTNSKYMAYASPFVLFYVLIILYERYFDKLYVLYPREWLSPSNIWMFGSVGVSLLLLELTVITALGFVAAAKRRIAQL